MDNETGTDVARDLTIRGVPASVHRVLAARAEARQMSLNTYLVELLTQFAETPMPDEQFAELRGVR